MNRPAIGKFTPTVGGPTPRAAIDGRLTMVGDRAGAVRSGIHWTPSDVVRHNAA
jgi:hypothetical protein